MSIKALYRKIGWSLFFVLLLCSPCLSAESDTTKGSTRIVQKSTDLEDYDPKEADTYLEDESSDTDSSGFFEELFVDIVIGVVRYGLLEPLKGFLLYNPNLDTFQIDELRGGVGLSFINGTRYKGVSSNHGMNYSFDIFLKRSGKFLIREHVAAHFSPISNVYGVFERDVYVNNVHIGTERDEATYYVNDSYHFYTEIMYFPNISTFYIGAGAGPRHVRERIEFIRTHSYSPESVTMKDVDNDWIPALSFCIGKLFNPGTTNAALEFRYTLGLNQNRHQHSLPSDNTPFVKGYTLFQYQLFF